VYVHWVLSVNGEEPFGREVAEKIASVGIHRAVYHLTAAGITVRLGYDSVADRLEWDGTSPRQRLGGHRQYYMFQGPTFTTMSLQSACVGADVTESE
jgi:hypothetical protein